MLLLELVVAILIFFFLTLLVTRAVSTYKLIRIEKIRKELNTAKHLQHVLDKNNKEDLINWYILYGDSCSEQQKQHILSIISNYAIIDYCKSNNK